MILILDNYDSFVFNLARYCEELGEAVAVYRNDDLTLHDIARLQPDRILLSPGPGRPGHAGIMVELIKTVSGSVPILGICLGHQAIGEAFGGRIVKAKEPMHGRSSLVDHNAAPPFEDIPSPFRVGRYHSLVVDPVSLPACLSVTAKSELGEIMGLKHKEHPTYGLQFHPESILTEHGYQLLRNFISGNGSQPR